MRRMAAILNPGQGDAFMQGISRIVLLQDRAHPVVTVQWDAQSKRLRFSDETPLPQPEALHHAGV